MRQYKTFCNCQVSNQKIFLAMISKPISNFCLGNRKFLCSIIGPYRCVCRRPANNNYLYYCNLIPSLAVSATIIAVIACPVLSVSQDLLAPSVVTALNNTGNCARSVAAPQNNSLAFRFDSLSLVFLIKLSHCMYQLNACNRLAFEIITIHMLTCVYIQ